MAQEVQTIVPGLLAKLSGIVVVGEPIVHERWISPAYGKPEPTIVDVAVDLLFLRPGHEDLINHPIAHYERREYAVGFNPGFKRLSELQEAVDEIEKTLASAEVTDNLMLDVLCTVAAQGVKTLNVFNYRVDPIKEPKALLQVYLAKLLFNEPKGREVITLSRDLYLPEGEQHITANHTITHVLHSAVTVYPNVADAKRNLKIGQIDHVNQKGVCRPYQVQFLPETINAFSLVDLTESPRYFGGTKKLDDTPRDDIHGGI